MLTVAGHGGQTKDLDGDEEDGYDEVIYPVDFRQVGHIVDDEMHDIMVKPLQPGVRLTAIFDSCHSGRRNPARKTSPLTAAQFVTSLLRIASG